MIRILVVDDEEPARAKIRKLLAAERDVTVVGEAADGDAAVARIRELAPDVVLLDIQMPKKDGFEVIDEVGVDRMPAVVFVTAYDEHALRAFDVQALDYLLKPFAPSRFRRVLDRVRARLAAASPDLHRRLQALLESAPASPRFLRLLLVHKEDERELLLPVDRIDIARAERNYVRLVTAGGAFVRRSTLTELESRLDPDRFLRINRSEIVRLDAIRELQAWFHGDYRVVLHNGEVLTWSRRYRARSKHDF